MLLDIHNSSINASPDMKMSKYDAFNVNNFADDVNQVQYFYIN